ncbi:TetR/AcrR family transcriptional regulator [Streptomyces oceani]|uniref:TetR family transcriptional regulator n=1 Tax=Streptomyces oceani TaxID=1075402 RepID=A0A1E7KJI4_9ACTN|nr:TetR/AcrR family transcriptional regulator C-terminal domain-containing protein [Streptomyces oceani]OEV04066.1 TetR family transcriptional regulator [Streptomyces oceani]
MALSDSGRGDPRQTLRLLWRGLAEKPGKPARGRKPRITADQIVSAAVSLADRERLPAVTMEGVAAALGVGTMSLYTHVPGKAELMDLMVDAAWGELDLPAEPPARPEGWREQVQLYARETLALYRRHPWLREITTVRPPLGPGLLGRQEYLLSSLADIGLPARQVTASAGAVVAFVDATAGFEAEHQHAHEVTGQTEAEWWAARQSFWEDLFDPPSYPTITRLWAADGLAGSTAESVAEAREFGLRALLDGIEAAVRTPPTGR